MADAVEFLYTVLGENGARTTGRIEAPSKQAVADSLRARGLTPVAIDELVTSGLNREISFGKGRVKPKDVALVMRELATMVEAGLPLLTALQALVDQLEDTPLGKMMRQVAQVVQNGGSLADGLAEHPEIFSPVVLAMVKAGEMGGFLDQILVMIAENLESELKLKRAVKSAMVYPAVILVFTCVVVILMLMFIVPTFEEIFASLGSDLPIPTKMLVVAADAAKFVVPVLVVAAVVGSVWWSKHKNDLAVRNVVDPLKLRIPLVGTLLNKVAVARFCRALGTMARVGVPIVQALEVTSETAGNVVIGRAVGRVREAVLNGKPMGQAIAAEPAFGPLVSRMVGVGEDSGALDAMLDKVAHFYEDEVDATTASITSIIEPVLIIFVGTVVGAMLISLYLPIFQLSTGVE